MKLHYSQTCLQASKVKEKFYYLMKLHYSQTYSLEPDPGGIVLLPYEITLLSNVVISMQIKMLVLLPYEITLLSNG